MELDEVLNTTRKDGVYNQEAGWGANEVGAWKITKRLAKTDLTGFLLRAGQGGSDVT